MAGRGRRGWDDPAQVFERKVIAAMKGLVKLVSGPGLTGEPLGN